MKRLISSMLVLLFVCMCVVGCSSGKYSTTDSLYDSEHANGTFEKQEAGMASPDAGDKNAQTSSQVSAEVGANDLDTRKLIKDVSLEVETKSFDEFMKGLQTEINGKGGFVQSADVYGNGEDTDDTRRATMVVRIPAKQLDLFLNKVSSLGNITYKTEKVQDVTMDYVDIQSHIKALQVEQKSLLGLLEEAKNLTDILSIQDRLTQVRSELESYETRLRTYNDLIAYSTITLSITEVERITPVQQGMWSQIGSDFSQSLNTIGKGARDLFVYFAGNLPYVLLLAIVALIIIIIVRLALRNTRKQSKAAPVAYPAYPPVDNQQGDKDNQTEK